jgi:YggT family protein
MTSRRQRGFAALHAHSRAEQPPPKRARVTRAEGAPDGLPGAKSAGLRTDQAKRSLMGIWPQSVLLADAVSRVGSFVDVFIGVYILLILAFIILSWIRLPYSVWLNRIQRFLYDVCDPYLRLFRRFVPPVGPLDLSPWVAVLVLVVLQRIIHTILNQFS